LIWEVDGRVRGEIYHNNPIPLRVAKYFEKNPPPRYKPGKLIALHVDVPTSEYISQKNSQLNIPFKFTPNTYGDMGYHLFTEDQI
jgi:hypothetical protein